MFFRVLGTLFVVVLLSMNLIAAEKTDFSGNWMFNEEKSVLDEMGRAFIPYKLVIVQNDNELTVQKTFTMENGEDMVTDEKMTLDGKECMSEFWDSPRITTASWSATKDTLNIKMKITFNQDGNNNEMLLQEAWSLHAEGKQIVINHFSTSTWGERKITMAFDKQEAKQ
jgi:hypothetical protein